MESRVNIPLLHNRPISQMLAIDDEQRAVRVLQYGTADWSEKFVRFA